MFPVEIQMHQRDENALPARMTAMREWLDHRRFEPSVFRYSFAAPGIVFRIEFTIQAEAAAFAQAFGGRVAEAAADLSPP